MINEIKEVALHMWTDIAGIRGPTGNSQEEACESLRPAAHAALCGSSMPHAHP